MSRRPPGDRRHDITPSTSEPAGDRGAIRIALTPDEREAIARSKAAAARGEFATDELVRAVWAKHSR